MNRLQTIILSTFLALAGTVCVAEIPKIPIPRNAFSSWVCERTNENIWDVICLEESIANKMPRHEDATKCINQYSTIVRPEGDTLLLFICNRYMINGCKINEYYTYGWNAHGDTLVFGNTPDILEIQAEFSKYPIMKYLSKWDIDTIARFYSTHGIISNVVWNSPSGRIGYVFRMIFGNGSIQVQCVEIDCWTLHPQDIIDIFL